MATATKTAAAKTAAAKAAAAKAAAAAAEEEDELVEDGLVEDPVEEVDESNRRADIEEWLDSYGVQWDYVPQGSIADVDLVRSLKNQARMEALHGPTVEAYEIAWLTGASFPPIVTFRPDTKGAKQLMIDGNHRSAGAVRAKKTHLDRYEVYGAMPKTVAAMCRDANNRNGLSLSEDERILNAIYAHNNQGLSLKAAAEANHVPYSKVQSKFNQTSVLQRAQELDLDLHAFSKLSAQIRTRLNNLQPDEVFVEAVKLTIKAGFKIDHVNELCLALNATKSFKQKMGILHTWNTTMQSRIEDNLGGRRTSNDRRPMTRKQRFGMALGQFQTFGDDFSPLLDAYSDVELPGFLDNVDTLIARLTTLYDKGMARL